jgi:hypothetical protein
MPVINARFWLTSDLIASKITTTLSQLNLEVLPRHVKAAIAAALGLGIACIPGVDAVF